MAFIGVTNNHGSLPQPTASGPQHAVLRPQQEVTRPKLSHNLPVIFARVIIKAGRVPISLIGECHNSGIDLHLS